MKLFKLLSCLFLVTSVSIGLAEEQENLKFSDCIQLAHKHNMELLAYRESLIAQQHQEKTIESLKRLKQHASNSEHFFKEGWIWRTDVLEAQVQVARDEQDKIIAENNLVQLKMFNRLGFQPQAIICRPYRNL